jgi:hypothetical protein
MCDRTANRKGMKMRPISFMAATAAALLSTTIVGAVPCGLPGWSGWDLDRDGRVTQPEFDTYHEMRWAQRTAQGYHLRNANRAPQFAMLDRDGDGTLSTAEITARRATHPHRMGQQRVRRHYAAWSGPRPDCPNRDIPPGLVSSPVPQNCPNRLVPAGLVHQ